MSQALLIFCLCTKLRFVAFLSKIKILVDFLRLIGLRQIEFVFFVFFLKWLVGDFFGIWIVFVFERNLN